MGWWMLDGIGYSELWGGCGPQNNGSQWTKGVGQDWHTNDADNGGLICTRTTTKD